jgi:hypothetical protein
MAIATANEQGSDKCARPPPPLPPCPARRHPAVPALPPPSASRPSPPRPSTHRRPAGPGAASRLSTPAWRSSSRGCTRTPSTCSTPPWSSQATAPTGCRAARESSGGVGDWWGGGSGRRPASSRAAALTRLPGGSMPAVCRAPPLLGSFRRCSPPALHKGCPSACATRRPAPLPSHPAPPRLRPPAAAAPATPRRMPRCTTWPAATASWASCPPPSPAWRPSWRTVRVGSGWGVDGGWAAGCAPGKGGQRVLAASANVWPGSLAAGRSAAWAQRGLPSCSFPRSPRPHAGDHPAAHPPATPACALARPPHHIAGFEDVATIRGDADLAPLRGPRLEEAISRWGPGPPSWQAAWPAARRLSLGGARRPRLAQLRPWPPGGVCTGPAHARA